MKISDDTKLIAIGTLLVLFIFGGGSIFMTYRAARKNTAPPTPLPHPSEFVLNATPTPANTALANPASVNCTKVGGTVTIKKRGDGGEYGICTFGDGKECEEWALLRGSCPNGGLKITGFDNEAEIYCAITGGKTLAVTSASCTLPDGTRCDKIAYFNGTCSASIPNK